MSDALTQSFMQQALQQQTSDLVSATAGVQTEVTALRREVQQLTALLAQRAA